MGIVEELNKSKKKQRKQQKIIDQYKNQQTWLKWLGGGLVAAVVLLLLFLGYSTDWLSGLNKDSLKKLPITADSATTPANGAGGLSGSGSSSGTGAGGTNTVRETTTSNTTTNNTTTNNNTTTKPPTTVADSLIKVYEDTNAGDSFQQVVDQASGLGIAPTCENVLLVRVCSFTVDGETIVVKSVNDVVTSVTSSF